MMRDKFFHLWYLLRSRDSDTWIVGWTDDRDGLRRRHPSEEFFYVQDQSLDCWESLGLKYWAPYQVDLENTVTEKSETYAESVVEIEAFLKEDANQLLLKRLDQHIKTLRHIKDKGAREMLRDEALYLRGGVPRFWVRNKKLLGNGLGQVGCISIAIVPLTTLFVLAFGAYFYLGMALTVIAIVSISTKSNFESDRVHMKEIKESLLKKGHSVVD